MLKDYKNQLNELEKKYSSKKDSLENLLDKADEKMEKKYLEELSEVNNMTQKINELKKLLNKDEKLLKQKQIKLLNGKSTEKLRKKIRLNERKFKNIYRRVEISERVSKIDAKIEEYKAKAKENSGSTAPIINSLNKLKVEAQELREETNKLEEEAKELKQKERKKTITGIVIGGAAIVVVAGAVTVLANRPKNNNKDEDKDSKENPNKAESLVNRNTKLFGMSENVMADEIAKTYSQFAALGYGEDAKEEGYKLTREELFNYFLMQNIEEANPEVLGKYLTMDNTLTQMRLDFEKVKNILVDVTMTSSKEEPRTVDISNLISDPVGKEVITNLQQMIREHNSVIGTDKSKESAQKINDYLSELFHSNEHQNMSNASLITALAIIKGAEELSVKDTKGGQIPLDETIKIIYGMLDPEISCDPETGVIETNATGIFQIAVRNFEDISNEKYDQAVSFRVVYIAEGLEVNKFYEVMDEVNDLTRYVSLGLPIDSTQLIIDTIEKVTGEKMEIAPKGTPVETVVENKDSKPREQTIKEGNAAIEKENQQKINESTVLNADPITDANKDAFIDVFGAVEGKKYGYVRTASNKYTKGTEAYNKYIKEYNSKYAEFTNVKDGLKTEVIEKHYISDDKLEGAKEASQDSSEAEEKGYLDGLNGKKKSYKGDYPKAYERGYEVGSSQYKVEENETSNTSNYEEVPVSSNNSNYEEVPVSNDSSGTEQGFVQAPADGYLILPNGEALFIKADAWFSEDYEFSYEKPKSK